MYNNHKVVVSMTSWTKRIDNCAQIIRDVVSGTVKPDNVYLNLSQQEFPQMESQLPDELIRVLYEEQTVKINWVQGPNTKPWKKVFPILQYLNDDDLIIIIDDDCEIDPRLVELRVREFDENKGRCAIMGGACHPKTHLNIPIFGITTYNTICPTSLMQKKMLKGWESFVCEELIQTMNDDCVYSLICLLNGFTIVPSKYMNLKRPKALDVHGLHKAGLCLNDSSTIKVFEEVYNRDPSRNFRRDLFLGNVLNLVIFDSCNIAGDNGEYLYRKIRDLYPNVKMVFLLSSDCHDWERLRNDEFNLMSFDDKRVIQALKNATFILFSKYDIGHTLCAKMFDVYKHKCVFLQHGTTSKIQNMENYFVRSVSKLAKYMVCSSQEEESLVRKYSGNRLIPVRTGFPRRDFLLGQYKYGKYGTAKKVFISFHWRHNQWHGIAGTQYLYDINNLLNSPQLKDMCLSGEFQVSFLPHAMFMKYLNLFNVPEWINVPIDRPFQESLLDADILVTDFSSNSFEMAYMNKPSVIYVPGLENVKEYHKNYHLEYLNYPHMFYCQDQKMVFQKIFELAYSDVSTFDFAGKLFDHVDTENSRRLVDWMVQNGHDMVKLDKHCHVEVHTRQNIKLKQLFRHKPKSHLFRIARA